MHFFKKYANIVLIFSLVILMGCSGNSKRNNFAVSTDPFSLNVTSAKIFTIPANDDIQEYLPENYGADRSRIYYGRAYGGISSSEVIYYHDVNGWTDMRGYDPGAAVTMVEVRFDVANISRVLSANAESNNLDPTESRTLHYSIMDIINNLRFTILPHDNVTYTFDYVLKGLYDPENDVMSDCIAYKLFMDSSMFVDAQYAFLFQETNTEGFDGFSLTFQDFDDSGLVTSTDAFEPYYVLKEVLEQHGYAALVLNSYNLALREHDEIVVRTDKTYYETLREVRRGIYEYPGDKPKEERISDIVSILLQIGAAGYVEEEISAIAQREYAQYNSEVDLLLAFITIESAGQPVDYDILLRACSGGKSEEFNEFAAMLRVIETDWERMSYFSFSCAHFEDIAAGASDEIKDAILETPFIAMMRAGWPAQEITIDRETFRPSDPLPGGYLLTKSMVDLPEGLHTPGVYYENYYEMFNASLFGVCDPDNISVFIDEEISVSFVGNYKLRPGSGSEREVAVYSVTTTISIIDAISGELLFAKQLGDSGVAPSDIFVSNTFDGDVYYHVRHVTESTIDEIMEALGFE